ncbi:membrane protein [Bradyrhizobium nitroreducens]|uniref:Membrane protein n=1 Tax=Bradyrhizobium nitroreducens TaxID=709803 RepID=A0A2M6U6G6_9BRAD|nr:general stress protein [Bradyrhizobium nitroreducens]PIT00177.1 membrane protein [Bradyrhizobium nitroreducens]
MTVTISRLYDNYADAERAVTRLEAAGVPHSDISIVANNSDNWYGSRSGKVDRDRDGVDDRAEGAGTGAGIGAGLGGAAGLLAGLGLLAIPGLGPVVAAGWLASMAVGAAAGAATGGIIGALTEAGVSREDASRYAEGVRRGGTLVTARVPDQDRARLDALLNERAVNLQERSAAWQKSGWTDFDAASPPLSPEDVGRERELYGTGTRR